MGDMLTAISEGMTHPAPRPVISNAPSTFHDWCARVPTRAIAA